LPAPIRPVSADLLDLLLEVQLPRVDRVVYAVSADGSSEEQYRDAYVHGIANFLDVLESLGDPPVQLIYVSTTAVYGDEGGEWVDETTLPSPDDYRGAAVLEGEELVRAGSIPSVCLRLAGIYGPGRTRLLERVRSGEARCPGVGPIWSNRIHRRDAAGALMHLLTTDMLDGTYIGVDDEPAPICEVYRYVAGLLGVPEPPAADVGRSRPSNKRCSNRLLTASGYHFEFPSFREGYSMLLKSNPAGVG
jgi:nucleoside-diphosphate-sugar epimerase